MNATKIDINLSELEENAEWHAEIIAKFRTTLLNRNVSQTLADKLTEMYAKKCFEELARPVIIGHYEDHIKKGSE